MRYHLQAGFYQNVFDVADHSYMSISLSSTSERKEMRKASKPTKIPRIYLLAPFDLAFSRCSCSSRTRSVVSPDLSQSDTCAVLAILRFEDRLVSTPLPGAICTICSEGRSVVIKIDTLYLLRYVFFAMNEHLSPQPEPDFVRPVEVGVLCGALSYV